MDNINFDENTVNKLKNMMQNGELNDVLSKIPPEMVQNFSSMMNNNSNNSSNSDNNNSSNSVDSEKNNNAYNNDTVNKGISGKNNNFDFSNIDMNTIMKMKSIMDKMNSKDNPSSNLLYSLKPYMRESRKEKIDQYAQLLNIANLTEILNEDRNKEQHPNG